MTKPTISKSHYDRLDQRRLWLTNRIEAKEKTGWETQHDKSERDALAAALAVLEVDPATTYPPVPEGWRELESGEVIQEGDQYPYCGIGDWTPVLADVGLRQSEFYYPHIRRIEPAPKHPPVPEGWRLVDPEKDGPKRGSDKYWSDAAGQWREVYYKSDKVFNDGFCDNIAYIRRIEPTYRPFASAEEFKPHRDRWWKYKYDSRETVRQPFAYSDLGHGNETWAQSFNRKVFDDGSPFGVEVKP